VDASRDRCLPLQAVAAQAAAVMIRRAGACSRVGASGGYDL